MGCRMANHEKRGRKPVKSFTITTFLCAALLLFPVCSRQDYRPELIGSWEWTGDACGKDGICRKEIITDEESREVFTADGLYLSKRTRTGYIVDGAEIRLATDKESLDTVYGEIVSIRRNVMLIKKGGGIRRYSRIGNAK